MRHTLAPHTFAMILIAIPSLLAVGCGGGDDVNPFAVVGEDMGNVEDMAPLPELTPRGDIDGDGRLDLLEELNNTDPYKVDEVCAESVFSIRPGVEPASADFIFITDTSGSMREELEFLKQGILDYFTPLLETGALDFTVLIIGAANDLGQGFCLPDGLEGSGCDGGHPAVNSRFMVYDARVHSANSLEIINATFDATDPWDHVPGGWRKRLRPGATPVFVELSDDNSYVRRDIFEAELRKNDTENQLYDRDGRRRFIWHSVVGVAGPRFGLYYEPTAPVIREACSTAPNAGMVYQELSRETGGLRFPVCDAVNYAAVIDALAKPLVEGTAIPCTFNLPRARNFEDATDSNTLGLQLRLGGRPAELLDRVGNELRCTDRSYYLERLSNAQYVVRLCDSLCEIVTREEDAELLATASCLPSDCTASITHGSCSF